jgi:hypothetical protein
MVWLFLHKSFFFQENEARIDFLKSAWSEVMDQKWGENQASTSHLLCNSSELPMRTILGYRDEDGLFSIILLWIGIW